MRVAAMVFVAFLLTLRPASAVTIGIPTDFLTIQEGLDAAAPGDTVFLADGTYTGDGNRDLDFQGKSLVLISASGDPALCMIDVAGSVNHRGFTFHSGESRSTRVVGVTVRRGYLAAYTYPLDYSGGGVLCCNSSSPTFVRCVIERCWAGDQDFGMGGGVACIGVGTNPLFQDCVIRYNWSGTAGGGIRTEDSSPEFSNCTISGNFVHRGRHIGGGLSLQNGAPRFSNCIVSQNDLSQDGDDIAGDGWGAGAAVSSSAIFEGCRFVENVGRSGAGVFCKGAANSVFTDCVFEANIASGGAGGLGATNGASPQLTRCTFIGNQAGGNGGGVYLTEANQSVLTDCVFFANHATWTCGGVGIESGASPTMIGCTIVANTSDHTGSGIYVAPTGSLTLDRCLVAFNTPHGGIVSNGTVTLGCCDIYGNSTADTMWVGLGLNNFSVDPWLCDISSGTLSLGECSPCLPGRHPGGGPCGLIGAFGVGCSGPPSPVTPTTWGFLKALRR